MHAPTRTRAIIAAAMLLAAIVARIASIFLWPVGSDAGHAQELAAAAAHPAAWFAATWVEAAAWLLAIPAVLVLIGSVRRRGAALVLVGGGVLVLGYATLGCATSALNGVTSVLAAQSDQTAALQILKALHAAPSLTIPVVAIAFGMLGAVLLAVGLVRGRRANWALPVVAVLIAVGSIVTGDADDHLIILAGFLPTGAFWLWLALILRRRDIDRAEGAAAVGVSGLGISN